MTLDCITAPIQSVDSIIALIPGDLCKDSIRESD